VWADVKLFVILVGIVVIGSIGLAQQNSFSMPMPVDFDDWTEETYPPLSGSFPEALWTIDDPPTNSMITQSLNGQPTFFFSDFSAYNKRLTITMTVDPTVADNDFIGFAIGFNQGDASPGNPAADYLILDWKQDTQAFDFDPPGNGGTASAGMVLSRVSGVPSPDELWQHADHGDGGGSVTEIVRATSLGNVGWIEGEVNTFEITYQPTRIIVKVNGQEEFNEIGSFPNGMVTLYNFSQDKVTYQATSLVIIPEALPDSATVPENSINNVLAPTLTGFDDDGSPLTGFTISTPPTDGTLDISGASISCDDPAIPVTCTFGPVTYTPDPDFFGSDPFEFTVTDGIDTSLPALFEIIVDDGDGIDRDVDNCPFISNPNQEDTDENGIGDACQDVDGDEVLDIDDNCPFISNPNQEDTDGNGIGDACQDQELLVDATFPPGDTISVELPEDPDTGVFSISLELPETEGGNVVIEITDAGDTPGNFSFLGFVIDFSAPCSGVCAISFTFTQASLDEQGITLDQVTIFHDVNENGSFEDNEAIPTMITGSDPFTATADAAFTSKFSVGGVKALFLAGGVSSHGGSSPVLNSISYDGVTTTNDDGTIGFGGVIIDKILPINNLPTQTVKTGELFKLRLPFYEDSGVGSLQHVAVYFLQGDEKTIDDSQTSVIYRLNNPVEISDSTSFISNVTVSSIVKSAYDVDIIFEMVFNFPTDEPVDIKIRSWDKYRRSSDILFNDFLQVIESGSDSQLPVNTSNDATSSWSKSIESSAVKSTTVFKEEFDGIQVTFDMKDGQSVTKNFKIPLWVKNNANWWSHEEISDDDFVAGMKYLIEQKIMDVPQHKVTILEPVHEIVLPNWVKNNASWWADGLVSDQEFVQAIEWLIDEGVMTV